MQIAHVSFVADFFFFPLAMREPRSGWASARRVGGLKGGERGQMMQH